MVFTKKKVQVQAVIERIRAAIREAVLAIIPKDGNTFQKVSVEWKAPAEGLIKINYDGGFKKAKWLCWNSGN